MGRVDWLDPDTGLDDNAHTRMIFGVGYRLHKNVEALVDAELVQYQEAADVAANERRLFFHTSVGF
jgi:predicted porin